MSKLTNCLIKKDSSCIPIWFMRQAGRYLPEFRLIRSKNLNFIKLCLDKKLSSEITLQPISRFDLDAAIIFSDILMVPYGLGQDVNFEKNKGPILSNFNIDHFYKNNIEDFTNKLKPVYDSIYETRKKLDKEKSLISFIGSPWTLIVYMLGLKKQKNILDIETLKKKKTEINLILNHLNNFLCAHIKNQINAGADVVQIFDSWAGLIPENHLNAYCYEPNLKLTNFCKENKIPVICFPKGLNKNYYDFIKIVSPDCVSIDYNVDPDWAIKNFNGICIQGGMDPKVLLQEKDKMYSAANRYLSVFKDYPYIFNLGHGLLPETNPDNVEKLVRYVRNYKQL
jgi:uroporphyrinogen decarboxylase